jgi:hypothetical protein
LVKAIFTLGSLDVCQSVLDPTGLLGDQNASEMLAVQAALFIGQATLLRILIKGDEIELSNKIYM